MSDKKVLLISQVFYPDEVVVANLFTNLCSVLVRNNTEIEVWRAQPSYTCNRRQPKYRVFEGIKINYLLSTNFPKDKLSGSLLNYFSFSFSKPSCISFTKGGSVRDGCPE
jgi:hypothetical protein